MKTQSRQKLLSDDDQSISSFDESEKVATKVQVDIHRQEDLSIENKSYILDKFLNDSSREQDLMETAPPIPKPRKNRSEKEKGQGDNNVKYDSDKDINTKNSSSTPVKTSSDEIVVGKSESGSNETFIFEKPQAKKRTKTQHEIENIKKRNDEGKNELVEELKMKIARRNKKSEDEVRASEIRNVNQGTHEKEGADVEENAGKTKLKQLNNSMSNERKEKDGKIKTDTERTNVNDPKLKRQADPLINVNEATKTNFEKRTKNLGNVNNAFDYNDEDFPATNNSKRTQKPLKNKYEDSPPLNNSKRAQKPVKNHKIKSDQSGDETKDANDYELTLSKADEFMSKIETERRKQHENDPKYTEIRNKSRKSKQRKASSAESSRNSSDDGKNDKRKKKTLKFQSLKHSFKKQMSKMLHGDDSGKNNVFKTTKEKSFRTASGKKLKSAKISDEDSAKSSEEDSSEGESEISGEGEDSAEISEKGKDSAEFSDEGEDSAEISEDFRRKNKAKDSLRTSGKKSLKTSGKDSLLTRGKYSLKTSGKDTLKKSGNDSLRTSGNDSLRTNVKGSLKRNVKNSLRMNAKTKEKEDSTEKSSENSTEVSDEDSSERELKNAAKIKIKDSTKTVEKDSSKTIGKDSSKTIGNDSWKIKENNSTKMNEKDSSRTEGKDSSKTIGNDSWKTKGNDSTKINEKDSIRRKGKDSSKTIGNDSWKTIGNDSTKINEKDSSRRKGKDSSKTIGNDSTKTKDKDSLKSKDKDSPKTKDKDNSKIKDKDSLKTKDKDNSKIKDKDSLKTKDKDNSKIKDKDSSITKDKDSSKTKYKDSSNLKLKDNAESKDLLESKKKDTAIFGISKIKDSFGLKMLNIVESKKKASTSLKTKKSLKPSKNLRKRNETDSSESENLESTSETETDENEGQAKFNEGRTKMSEGQTKIKEVQTKMNEGQTNINEGQTKMNEGQTKMNEGQTNMNEGQTNMNEGQTNMNEGQTNMNEGQTDINEGQTKMNEGQKETMFDIFRAKSANKSRKSPKTESKENLIDDEARNAIKKKSITLKSLKEKFKKKISNIGSENNEEDVKKRRELDFVSDNEANEINTESDDEAKEENASSDDEVKGRNRKRYDEAKRKNASSNDEVKGRNRRKYDEVKGKNARNDEAKGKKARSNKEAKKKNARRDDEVKGKDTRRDFGSDDEAKGRSTRSDNETKEKYKKTKLQNKNDALSEVEELESLTDIDEADDVKDEKLKRLNVIQILGKMKENVHNENIEMQDLSFIKNRYETSDHKNVNESFDREKQKTTKMYSVIESSDQKKQKRTKIYAESKFSDQNKRRQKNMYEEMESSNEDDEVSSEGNEAKSLRFGKMNVKERKNGNNRNERKESANEEINSENEAWMKAQRPKSARKASEKGTKDVNEGTESENDSEGLKIRLKRDLTEERKRETRPKSSRNASRSENQTNEESENENEVQIKSRKAFKNEETGRESALKVRTKSSRNALRINVGINEETESENESRKPKSSRRKADYINEESESENESPESSRRKEDDKNESHRLKTSRKASKKQEGNVNKETESENEPIKSSRKASEKQKKETENDNDPKIKAQRPNERSKNKHEKSNKHSKSSENEDYASSDDQIKRRTKARRKKRSSKEETSLTNYAYEKIMRIMVHRTDRLLLDSRVIHPVVKIHIIYSESGDYVKKSDKRRNVLFYNESQEIDYIGAVMTQAYGLREHRSLHPNWEEAIIINDDIQYISDNQSVIIIFEVMDFLSMNGIKNMNRKDLGWHKIAWAFLKPTTPAFSNIGKKLRLQLYYPSTIKKTSADHCNVYHWWSKQRFKKYPSTLYVTIDGIISPDTVIETLRSKAPNEVEKGRSTLADYGKIVPNNDDVDNEGVKEEALLLEKRLWSRQENQLCKIPNKCVAKLDSYDDGCFCLKFSNDGLFLACGVMEDGAFLIVVYSVLENTHVSTLPGHQGLIYEIIWTKNDKMLLSASADCTVCIWDMTTYKFIQMLPHPSFIYATIIFENTIITGCFDGCVRVWLIDSRTDYDLIEELNEHEGYITSLCCNVNGTLLYSSDSVGVVNIWKFYGENWKLRKDMKILDLKNVVINQIILHKKERRLLINSRDSKIRLVDIKTGYVLQTYNGALNNRVHISCAFTPCGTYVTSGSENGELHFWNAENGTSEHTLKPYNHNVGIHCVQFHPKDNVLVVSHYGNNLPILVYKYVRDGDEKSARTLSGSVGNVINRKRGYSEHIDGSTLSFKDVLEKMDSLIGKQST